MISTRVARRSTLIALLAFGAAVSHAAEPPHRDRQIVGPTGYFFAQAELSRQGDGFVLWKAAEGMGAVLERYDGFERTRSYPLDGLLAKGFLRSGDRILLQGIGAEGSSDSLVEVDGETLRPLWSSDELVAAGVDRDEVAVSRDLEWWYVPEYGPTSVRVRAGRIGEADSLRWTVDVEGADPFSASIAAVTEEPTEITVAFAAQGEGWLLAPGRTPRPLALPEGCELYRLTGAADGFWADCGGGRVAIFPARPPAEGPVEAVAVDRVTDLRFLPSGRAVGVVRRHGAPGHMTLLSVEGRQLRRGPQIPYPAVLGQVDALAGEVALIELDHGNGNTRPRYRVLPLPPELTGSAGPPGAEP